MHWPHVIFYKHEMDSGKMVSNICEGYFNASLPTCFSGFFGKRLVISNFSIFKVWMVSKIYTKYKQERLIYYIF